MVARSPSNEISITRVYDAPLVKVWEAWTDPEQAALWWGPRGFTLTTHSKELKPGGIWHYTMHGPDGTDYPNKAFYHVVEPLKKLVYDHGGYDDRPPLFRVTALFSESEGKTTLQMTMSMPSVEEAEAIRKRIKAAGGTATWDRLAEYLDDKEKGIQSFVINRSFNAPVNTLFAMWAHPGEFKKWLPPAPFEMEILRENACEGGDCFFRMAIPGGVTLYEKFNYEEITEPSRMRYVQTFCNESEQPAHHPGLPVFPESMNVTVLFVEEEEDSTRVTVTMRPSPNSSPEEIKAFQQVRGDMTQGWTNAFDQLEAIVCD